MNNKRLRYLSVAAGVVFAAAAWGLFAPTQAGGTVTYVSIVGNSMEPKLEAGDLVLARAERSYDVGDIVAYHSKQLNRIVLHRVVAREGSALVLKGDNNDWKDAERPSADDIIGKMWAHVPAAGKAIGTMKSPMGAAVVAAALAFLFVFPTSRSKKPMAPPRNGSSAVAPWAAGVLALCAAAALVSFMRPASITVALDTKFEHRGTFTYTAPARRGAVYADGRVNTGEPVFLSLATRVDVAFDYALAAPQSRSVEGTVGLSARVGDPTGWNRTIELMPARPFEGPRAETEGTLDLRSIRKQLEAFETQTGLVRDSYPVTLVPEVEVNGTVGGRPMSDTFGPELPLQMDGIQLQLVPQGMPVAGEEPSGDPLKPAREGSVSTAVTRPEEMSILGASVPVERMRVLAVAGALAAGLVLLWSSGGRSQEDPRARVRMGDRSFLVRVTTRPTPEGRPVHDVESLTALVSVARRLERFVLHFEDEHLTEYAVDDGQTLYRFRPGDRVAQAWDPAPGSSGAAS